MPPQSGSFLCATASSSTRQRRWQPSARAPAALPPALLCHVAGTFPCGANRHVARRSPAKWKLRDVLDGGVSRLIIPVETRDVAGCAELTHVSVFCHLGRSSGEARSVARRGGFSSATWKHGDVLGGGGRRQVLACRLSRHAALPVFSVGNLTDPSSRSSV